MSDSKVTTRGVSALDRAHAARLAKQLDEALRLSASILNAYADDAGAAWLVARLLADEGRTQASGPAAVGLVERFIRRGDLSSAILAAHLAVQSGQPADPSLRAIADAFGKGSSRVAEGASPVPPPLPADPGIAAFFAQLSGPALLDAAEKVLARALGAADPVDKATPLPQLPLFGELAPAVLHKLLSTLQLREFSAGAYVVRQGAEGVEAFLLARGLLNVVREQPGASSPLAVLGPGAVFGEMALVSDAPRAASVVAVEAAHIFAAPRASLEALAAREPTIGRALGSFCHQRMVSNLMRLSSILSAIDPAKRPELIARFTTETFPEGAVLVQQGEETSRLFLIASGGVEVRRTDAEGDPVVLAQLGAGDVVGEISLVLRRPATAHVVAVHTTVALALTREQFQEAIREHPGLLQQLYELATQRDEETRSVVAQEAREVSDIVLL